MTEQRKRALETEARKDTETGLERGVGGRLGELQGGKLEVLICFRKSPIQRTQDVSGSEANGKNEI